MQSVLFSSKKSTYFLTGPHVGFDFVEKNKEGEGVLEFAESLDLAVCNIPLQRKPSHLVTEDSGGVKTQVDYILTKKSC